MPDQSIQLAVQTDGTLAEERVETLQQHSQDRLFMPVPVMRGQTSMVIASLLAIPDKAEHGR